MRVLQILQIDFTILFTINLSSQTPADEGWLSKCPAFCARHLCPTRPQVDRYDFHFLTRGECSRWVRLGARVYGSGSGYEPHFAQLPCTRNFVLRSFVFYIFCYVCSLGTLWVVACLFWPFCILGARFGFSGLLSI